MVRRRNSLAGGYGELVNRINLVHTQPGERGFETGQRPPLTRELKDYFFNRGTKPFDESFATKDIDFRNMGRPAVGYDLVTRPTIPEADMYKSLQNLQKKSKALPPKTTEETTAKGKKFEDLLRSRMSKF